MKLKNTLLRRLFAASSTGALLLIAASPAHATLRTWSGLGADANWQTALNWDALPVAGDTLAFAGSTKTANSNNFAAGTAFGSITFNPGASAFTLSGNQTQLGTPAAITAETVVTNNSASLQTLNTDLLLNGTTTDVERTFNAASGNITLGGVISGNGRLGVSGTGANTVTLGNANTYTGNITVASGVLSFSALNQLGNGTGIIQLGQGATTGTLRYTGGSDTTITRYFQFGKGTGAGDTGGATLEANGAGALIVNPVLSTNTGDSGATANRVLTLTGTSSADNRIEKYINNNTVSAYISVVKDGPGKWELSSSNLFRGSVTVKNGTLAYQSAGGGFGEGYGTIRVGNADTDATLLYVGTGDSVVNNSITIGNGSTVNDTGSPILTSSGGSALLFSNEIFNTPDESATAARSLTLNGSYTGGANTIPGVIADNSLSGPVSLTKSGPGTWLLAGNNTYSGPTVIEEGTLQIGDGILNGSLGFSPSVSIAAGAELVLNKKDFEFLTQDISGAGTLRKTGSDSAMNLRGNNSLHTGPLIIDAGSGFLAIDGPSALGSGPVVMNDAMGIWAEITVPNVISGTDELVIGNFNPDSQTVTLTGPNTYTGPTNVYAINGNPVTLLINGNQSAATGSVGIFGGTTLGGTGTIGGAVAIKDGGNLAFDLNTPAASHDSLAAASLNFEGNSTLTITSSGAVSTGRYSLVTTGVPVTGAMPIVIAPDGWSAVPSVSGNNLVLDVSFNYSTWAASNVGGAAASLDSDGDGIDNGVEYFMGTAGNAFTPAPAAIGGTVTWPRAAGTTISSFKVEVSSNLSTWQDAAIAYPANLSISPSSVAFTLPSGAGKIFARLSVTP
jgi:autotransporter-associated beta strand protein